MTDRNIIEGELTDARVEFRSGGWGGREAVVRIDIYAALYRELGPIAARHHKAITPYINQLIAERIAREAVEAAGETRQIGTEP